MSKEEILQRQGEEKYKQQYDGFRVDYINSNADFVFKAMDIFAEQQSIAFHKWLENDCVDWDLYDDKLYQLFLKSQQQ